MRLIANTRLFGRHPNVFLGRRSYLFVLGHMRSYSSLLCHILGSHDEIAGYAEMHLNYRSEVDLFRLRSRVYRSLDGELRGRYVLDKVLHNEYDVPPAILGRQEVNPIILVRRPVPAIASVLAMGSKIVEVPWYSELSAVTDYYVDRVARLAHAAQKSESPYLFVRAEDIIEQPHRVLSAIERFLGLDRPLTESYSFFPHTGERGWGDSSAAIRSGRIDRPQTDGNGLVIDDAAVARAVEAYERCARVLEDGSS